jgi:parallel beta-helix repeat protein
MKNKRRIVISVLIPVIYLAINFITMAMNYELSEGEKFPWKKLYKNKLLIVFIGAMILYQFLETFALKGKSTAVEKAGGKEASETNIKPLAGIIIEDSEDIEITGNDIESSGDGIRSIRSKDVKMKDNHINNK